MIVRILFSTVFAFALIRLFAQADEPVSIPPSPSAAKIAQFQMSPPNLYTGAVSQSVPLHSFNFDGIPINLSLNYHSGGIRVAEEASWVGLGWAFNPIGIVSRTIKGYNDLSNNSFLKGHVYDEEIPDEIHIFDRYYNRLRDQKVDTEPDKFTYNLLGSSGEFILSKKEKTGTVLVIKLKKNGDKIEFDETNQTFTVTTPQGYKGFFNKKEYTTVVGSGGCGANQDGCDPSCIDPMEIINYSKRAITSWYLTAIVSPRNHWLNFEYKHPNDVSNYVSETSPNYSERGTFFTSSVAPDWDLKACNKTIFEHVYLSKITGSKLPFEINFTTEDRSDIAPLQDSFKPILQRGNPTLLPPQRLTGISVSGIGGYTLFNKNIQLIQSYFDGGGANVSTDYKRLKLDAVLIQDQKYEFEYLLEHDFPEKQSVKIDYWGFYNNQDKVLGFLYPVSGNYSSIPWGGGTLNSLIGFYMDEYFYYQTEDRKANFNYGKIGLLSKVTFPTGGTSEFEYEGHQYKLSGNEVHVPSGDRSYNVSGLDGYDEETFYYSGYIYRTVQEDGIDKICGDCYNECKQRLEIKFGQYCKDFYQASYDPTYACYISSDEALIRAVELLDSDGVVLRSFNFDYLWGYGGENGSASKYEETMNLELEPGYYTIRSYRIMEGGQAKAYGTAVVNMPAKCSEPYYSYSAVLFNQSAGGARIKSVISKDADGTPAERRSFEYKESTSFTSGRLMSPLLHMNKFLGPITEELDPYETFCNTSNNCWKICPDNQRDNCVPCDEGSSDPDCKPYYDLYAYYVGVSGSYIPGTYAAEGSHIGYSKVKETFEAASGTGILGFKEHHFYNEPNVISKTGEYILELYNTANGRKETESTHKANGIVAAFEDPKYTNSSAVVGKGLKVQRFVGGLPGILEWYNIYEKDEVRHQVESFVMADNGIQIESITDYTYNDHGFVKSQVTTGSDQVTRAVEYQYPTDFSSGTVISKMKANNMIGTVIEQKSKVDGRVVEAKGVQYQLYNGIYIVPKESFVFGEGGAPFQSTSNGTTFGGGYESEVKYDQYDSYCNVTQYTSRNGISTVIIWGYNNLYPVAKIVNATQTQVDDVSYTAGTGYLDETEAHSLRNSLPQSQVTVYLYDTVLGLKQIIDPNGRSTFYDYDDMGRLKVIQDAEGNIIEEYTYHYQD